MDAKTRHLAQVVLCELVPALVARLTFVAELAGRLIRECNTGRT